MIIRKFGRILLILVCSTMFIQAQQDEKPLNLSLEDCVVKAMEHNLGLAFQVLGPEQADIAISRANEKFLPSMSFSFNTQDTSSASYSWLDAADQLTTSQNSYSTEFSQLVPTGGDFSVSLSNSKYDTNRTGTTINPSYRSTLRFNFTQPLLRNFGFKMARREIIVAKNQFTISEKSLEEALQNLIYNVENAYWNLYYNIENLKVMEQSLQLAQDLLEKNRRAVEVGTMAPIEIINAQATVAQREADILAAEAQVRNGEDRLKTIINLAAEYQGSAAIRIIPKDLPTYEKKEMGLDEALAVAMENRPDLQSARIGLKNSEIDLSYARNQTLPALNLSASYWSPGVSGNRLVYPPGNPFGEPIEIIPGGISNSLKDAFNFRYKNWSIGFTLDIPINNFISRAALAQAKVNLQQAVLQMKSQEQEIFTDIKIAVRGVETNFKRIQAYQAARELAEKQLEAEEEKLKVGLTTNYFVLQYQTALANTQSTELRAIIDYNLSLAALNRDLGISLKEKNIKITDVMNR